MGTFSGNLNTKLLSILSSLDSLTEVHTQASNLLTSIGSIISYATIDISKGETGLAEDKMEVIQQLVSFLKYRVSDIAVFSANTVNSICDYRDEFANIEGEYMTAAGDGILGDDGENIAEVRTELSPVQLTNLRAALLSRFDDPHLEALHLSNIEAWAWPGSAYTSVTVDYLSGVVLAQFEYDNMISIRYIKL